MPTLLLVDTSSYLYRAFHGLPDLRAPDGHPTGAIYGLISMLRNVVRDYEADYVSCVFDPKGKTFRDDVYPEYKATRSPMPDDLRLQIEPVFEAVDALGLNRLVVDNYEADDVIGTLAREGAERGWKVIISTGDKDMAQLVNEHVSLINTMKNERLGRDEVFAKFGVYPEQIIDYLTLVGDTVDNVPGVEKVGPKTAAKWLGEYGTLDNLLANADSIKGVVGENLRKAVDWLPTAKHLVTIEQRAPLPVHPESLVPHPVDRQTLLAMYTRYGFKTWRQEAEKQLAAEQPAILDLFSEPPAVVDEPKAPVVAANVEKHYETIVDEAHFGEWLARLQSAEIVAFDTETTSLDPFAARLVGMSFSVSPYHAAYLPLAHRTMETQLPLDWVLEQLKPWLENDSAKKVGQNLKYDQHVLANHGISFRGISDDTMLASYVIESHERHGLFDLALRHLGETTVNYEDITGKGAKQIGFDQVDLATASHYAAEDADLTLRVHQLFQQQLAEEPGLNYIYRDVEMPSSKVLWTMERAGILVDGPGLVAYSHELGLRLIQLEQQAYELAGQPFNLNSPKQLQVILFEKLAIPTKGLRKTPSGGFSTDEEVLQQLALDHPLPKILLEYRGLAKLKSTYAEKLPQMVNAQTGRVHTNYAQAVAITGRLASQDPNLQNIPIRTAEGRRIRQAFIAPAGSVLMSADYSQIELRIMAHLSGDQGLLTAFAAGQDIHRATAAEIFGVEPAAVTSEQRRYAKTINFGLIYGMSAFGLAGQLGIERSAAQHYIDRYFARYPGVADYMKRTRSAAAEQGYVETVFGRRLWLPEIRSSNVQRRQGAERAAINAPMQGTAADLIKLAMVAVQAWLESEKIGTKLILQVHDELILEVPDAEVDYVKTNLLRLMAGVAKLDVPLLAEVGVGMNWDEAH